MSRPSLSADSDTERFNMLITAAEIEAIDDWRYANRIPSRSEAVRRLIALGLSAPVDKENIGESR